MPKCLASYLQTDLLNIQLTQLMVSLHQWIQFVFTKDSAAIFSQSTQRVWHASHNADVIVSDIEGLKYLHAPTHSLSHLTYIFIVIINEKWNKMIVEYITGFINKEKQDECT